MKLTSSQIDDLIQELQGTIARLDATTEEMFGISSFDLDMETLEALDQEIFCCECCGWWYEIGELSREVDEDMVCQECEGDYMNSEEEDEEDE
jgi:hypothetical protein